MGMNEMEFIEFMMKGRESHQNILDSSLQPDADLNRIGFLGAADWLNIRPASTRHRAIHSSVFGPITDALDDCFGDDYGCPDECDGYSEEEYGCSDYGCTGEYDGYSEEEYG